MHSKLKITAAVAATVATVSTVAASPTWSRSDAASSETLTLVGTMVRDTFLDHDGDGMLSVGDEAVTAQRLIRRGKAVGRGGGACQVVAPAPGLNRNRFHCTLTLRLPGGQIALQGLGTFGEEGPQPMRMAITGGTGNYRQAHGQATVEEQATGEVRYRLSIRN